MFFARAFKVIISAIYCINLVLLLAALSCPYLDPDRFWIFSLLGLFFKIFVAVHIFLTVVFLIARIYPLVYFSLIMLLFCFSPVIHSTAFHIFSNHHEMASDNLKVMTYNIDDMGFFMRSSDTTAILETIKTESPDIVCFQEYYTNYEHKKSIVTRMEEMGYHYYYEYLTESPKPQIGAGQALFSKIPFQNIRPHPFPNTANGAFSADFNYRGNRFRLFNIHFQSITLRDHETKIPSSFNDFKSPQKDYYRMLFTKIMWGFQRRKAQVIKIKNEIKNTNENVILCGDFNDTPLSYTYHQMTEYLDDTFLKTNFGLGSTFAGRIPLQRIDYILVSPGIKPVLTRVVHNAGSDHFPVVGTVSFN
jgi:endonuclease/exonuclease/phosphatase family metal-dependent hydrolase